MLTPTRSKSNLERSPAKSAKIEEFFTSGSSVVPFGRYSDP